MKELARYLLQHRPLAMVLLVVAAVIVTVGFFEVLEGPTPTESPVQALPGAGSGQDYVYDSGDTGTHELDSGTPAPPLLQGNWVLDAPAATATALALSIPPQTTGPVADVLYSSAGNYCEGGKPYVNLQVSFGGNEKWLKGDVNHGWSTEGGMGCTFVSYDEQTYTALFNCSGAPDSDGLFVFTGFAPVSVHFGTCGGDGQTTEGGSAPARREPEPKCDDRKC